MQLRLMTDNLGFSDFILATPVRGEKSFFVPVLMYEFQERTDSYA